MKIRIVQMNIVKSVEENIQHAINLAQSESLKTIDFLIFPELFTTGYQLPIIDRLAHQSGDLLFERFQNLAKENRTTILLGSVAFKEKGAIYNRSFLIDQFGEFKSSYSKIHLFQLMNEQKYLKAGNAFHSFEIDTIPMTSIICYDLRFPELCRRAFVEQEVKAIFVPMEWPAPRTELFRSLLKARAIENQCFMIACNRVGEENGSIFEGASLVVDPYGNVVDELGVKEGILDVVLDFGVVDKVRSHMDCLGDRRSEYY